MGETSRSMGLLSEGSPLSWEETKKWADHVRQHGIQQFINQYHRLRDRSRDCLMWGDEVGTRGFQLSDFVAPGLIHFPVCLSKSIRPTAP